MIVIINSQFGLSHGCHIRTLYEQVMTNENQLI
jgi:hypothetical protein